MPCGQHRVLHACRLECRYPPGNIKLLRVVELGIGCLADLNPAELIRVETDESSKSIRLPLLQQIRFIGRRKVPLEKSIR